ncbi:MAG: PIN domain-containing protein [Lentisphaeria bacterium]|nr:PIN domain-containing protein [Lentisphaeria bacterium]
MIVPDVNLLVYAYNSDAPFHEQAKAWWKGLMNGCHDVGLPWVVSLGFLRLMTNPRVLIQPLTATEAMSHVNSWFERLQVSILQPGPRHLQILQSFADRQLLVSNLVTDAHLAALAIENGAELHSNDADFTRFPGLRHRNPIV